MFIDNVLHGFASVNPFLKASLGDCASNIEGLKRLARATGSDFNEAFLDRVLSQRLLGQVCCAVMMLGAIALAVAFADKNEVVACLFPLAAIAIQAVVHWRVRIARNKSIE